MNDDVDARLRQLRYRLRRQGMLELDAWLEPLVEQLVHGDAALVEAAGELLAQEPPVLMAMMRGERPLPDILVPWLALRKT
jgi:antitoxin CptB